jgi:hypothetical protein
MRCTGGKSPPNPLLLKSIGNKMKTTTQKPFKHTSHRIPFTCTVSVEYFLLSTTVPVQSVYCNCRRLQLCIFGGNVMTIIYYDKNNSFNFQYKINRKVIKKLKIATIKSYITVSFEWRAISLLVLDQGLH